MILVCLHFKYLPINSRYLTFAGFPCVFGLLPDRKKSTYQHLFRTLKEIAESMNRLFKPDRIMTDFESSLFSVLAHEVST